jgi:hypothetical protein
MAENFTYAGIPGYGVNPNAYTALDQNRADYWSGGKQKKQLDLNSLYQDQFNLLSTEKTNLYQNQNLSANAFRQQENQILQGIKRGMGGDNLKSYFTKGDKKKSLWQDPTQNAWWDMSDFGKGINNPYASQKWIPNTGKPIPPGAPGVTTKVIDGVTHVKNPNWTFGTNIASAGNWAANTGLGKIGSAGAGMPAGIAGIAGGLISHFGDDQDPTTHSATEKLGTGLSYGATGWQLGAMVNPVLAVPAAIGAAWWGNSMKTAQAKEFKKQQDEAKAKWDAKVLEFRQDMRKTNTIGGTKGADMNWWQSNFS